MNNTGSNQEYHIFCASCRGHRRVFDNCNKIFRGNHQVGIKNICMDMDMYAHREKMSCREPKKLHFQRFQTESVYGHRIDIVTSLIYSTQFYKYKYNILMQK